MNQRAVPLFCAFLFVTPVSEQKFLEYINAGDRLYGRFDNTRALAEYQRAYSLAPENFEVLVRMARIHNDIGRLLLWESDSAEYWYLQALSFAEQLKEHHPDRAEAYFWLALTRGSLVPFRSAGEKLEIGKEVVALAREALRRDSTQAQAFTILGIIYREGARLKWYERVIANVVFGGSLPGTIEESEEMFLRSIELQPHNIYAYVELARTYRHMGNHQRAVACLQKTLTFEPASLRERHQQEFASRQLRRLQAQSSQ